MTQGFCPVWFRLTCRVEARPDLERRVAEIDWLGHNNSSCVGSVSGLVVALVVCTSIIRFGDIDSHESPCIRRHLTWADGSDAEGLPIQSTTTYPTRFSVSNNSDSRLSATARSTAHGPTPSDYQKPSTVFAKVITSGVERKLMMIFAGLLATDQVILILTFQRSGAAYLEGNPVRGRRRLLSNEGEGRGKGVEQI